MGRNLTKILKSERSKRIVYLILGFLFCMGIILFRLLYLQVILGSNLKNRGERNCFKMEVIYPPRGNLLDCNGELLATNRPVYDLVWEGRGCLNFIENHRNILEKIFTILEEKESFSEKIEEIINAEKNGRRLKIFEDIPFDKLCSISELCCDSSNLVIINRFKRFYPNNKVASHILGYLGSDDQSGAIGKYGLEKIFQNKLEGEKGYVVHVVNAIGKRLKQQEVHEYHCGEDIKLTLDFKMQQMAEEAFEGFKAGAFIIMDPKNGAVKVMASFPNFDPNIFLSPISCDEYKQFGEHSTFLNRAVNVLYPPASLMKIVTYTTGLSEGVISKNSTFYCKGSIDYHGVKKHCAKHDGHGSVNSRQALAMSCNIPCYEMAKIIKIDTFADYAFKFGLGKKTDFLVGDKEGIIPNTKWKQEVMHDKWWPGESLSAFIGQSFTLVTPLQVARMVAAVASGSLVKPRILEQEEVASEPLDVKPDVLNFVRDSMHDSASYGSACSLKYLNGFDFWTKTGTAQTSSLEKSKGNAKLNEHGWLACYFSYKGEDPLVLVIIAERVGSSKVSVGIARKFFQMYADMRNGKARSIKEAESLTISQTNSIFGGKASMVDSNIDSSVDSLDSIEED